MKTVQLTISFATIGLIGEFAVLGAIGFISRDGVDTFWRQAVVAIIVLYATAAILGYVVDRFLDADWNSKFALFLVGAVVAECCLLIPTLAGAFIEYLPNAGKHRAFESYLFAPLFWFTFFWRVTGFLAWSDLLVGPKSAIAEIRREGPVISRCRYLLSVSRPFESTIPALTLRRLHRLFRLLSDRHGLSRLPSL